MFLDPDKLNYKKFNLSIILIVAAGFLFYVYDRNGSVDFSLVLLSGIVGAIGLFLTYMGLMFLESTWELVKPVLEAISRWLHK